MKPFETAVAIVVTAVAAKGRVLDVAAMSRSKVGADLIALAAKVTQTATTETAFTEVSAMAALVEGAVVAGTTERTVEEEGTVGEDLPCDGAVVATEQTGDVGKGKIVGETGLNGDTVGQGKMREVGHLKASFPRRPGEA